MEGTKRARRMRQAFVGIVLGLLCAVFGLGGFHTQVAHAAPTFSDVSASSWYVNYVSWVSDSGLMGGYKGSQAGRFGPEDTLTRGQMATILYRHANPGSAATTDAAHYGTSSRFSDVPGGVFYTAAVEWCADAGIVTGYIGSNNFGPEDPVTREQMATMLFRYASYLGKDSSGRVSLSSWPDGSSVSAFARDAVAWAASAGIMTGSVLPGGTYFQPQNPCTRAQAAKMLTVFITGGTLSEGGVGGHTVTFQSNGGTLIPSQSVAKGGKATFVEPARDGYQFGGWFADEALNYPYDFSSTVTSDITLYARWAKIQATITFEPNGGSGFAVTMVLLKGETYELPTYTLSGYTLAGWTTNANGTGKTYSNAGSHVFDGGTYTVYALWKKNSSGMAVMTFRDDSIPWSTSFTEPVGSAFQMYSMVEREGFGLIGWSHTSGATVPEYAVNEYCVVPDSGDVFYAVWRANDTTVTYHLNYDSDETFVDPAATGSEYLLERYLQSHTLEREGHVFTTWNTAQDGSGTSYYDHDAIIVPSGGLTLYAQWE